MMKILMLCQALARGRFQQPEIEPPEEDLNRMATSPAYGAGLGADPTPHYVTTGRQRLCRPPPCQSVRKPLSQMLEMRG
jgi:hypothetical protein